MRHSNQLIFALLSLLGYSMLVADSITIEPARDNTIYSKNDAASNALGILLTSTTGQANTRRCLLAFDVASQVPAGSTITGADLILTLREAAPGSGTIDHSLHRVMQDWGEADSFGNSGNGAPATQGDVTWSDRFFPDTKWSTPGGDFVDTPSASTPVGEDLVPITWASTPGMVSDVQAWLDAPGENHGWIILGSEDVLYTARKFFSRESSDLSLRPALDIEYTPPDSSSAYFRVTKTFSDGRDDTVDVMINCNGGLPLQQSFTIKGGGPGVNFVVQELDGEDTVCEVTESGGPDGYRAIYNEGTGCRWDGVAPGQYSCEIDNAAEPAVFTVNGQWVVTGVETVDSELVSDVSVYCTNEISGGFHNGTEYQFDGTLTGEWDVLEVSVDTLEHSAECRAEPHSNQSGVETANDCGPRFITAGGASTCTMIYTLFFEGIPVLSDAALAILALLMAVFGFTALRRVP